MNMHSTETILDNLYRKWGKSVLTLSIINLEINRKVDDDTERKVLEYSVSSLNRHKFILYLQRAKYDNEPLSIQQLVVLLDCQRTTVETMIKDVEEFGIVEIVRDEKNTRYLKGSEKLMSYYHNYTKWLFKFMTEEGGSNSSRAIATAILEIEKTVQ